MSEPPEGFAEPVERTTALAFVIRKSDFTVSAVSDPLAHLLGRPVQDVIDGPCTGVCAGLEHHCVGPGNADGRFCPVVARLAEGSEWTVAWLRAEGGGVIATRMAALAGDSEWVFIATRDPVLPARAATPDVLVLSHVLGTFGLTRIDGEPIHTRRPQALTLFKLLLCNRGVVLSEGELAEALWPQDPPMRTRTALRVLAHDLRTALEPDLKNGRASRFVVSGGSGYLMPEDAPLVLDCAYFTRLVGETSAALIVGDITEAERLTAEALSIYKGDLFGSDPSAAWFNTKRQQLRADWNHVITTHAVLLARKGDLLGATHELYGADLSNESAQRLLLLLLSVHQGHVAAMARFVDLSAEFRHHYGMPLSHETVQLVKRLDRSEPVDMLLREYFPLAVDAPLHLSRGSSGTTTLRLAPS